MDAMKMLLERRSIRAYEARPVEQELINQIIEAGRYGATGMGKQTVRYLYTQNPQWVRKLSEMNAKVMNATSDPFYGAPAVICVFADSNSSNWVKDGSVAVSNMMNAAYALGLGSCWINRCDAMFESEEGQAIMEKVGLTSNYKGVSCVIVGYPKGEHPTPKPRVENVVYTLE